MIVATRVGVGTSEGVGLRGQDDVLDDCLVWVEDFWKFDMPSGQLVQTSLEEREGYVTICEVFALMRFIVSPELLSTELDGTTKKSWDKSCPDGIVILLFAISVRV